PYRLYRPLGPGCLDESGSLANQPGMPLVGRSAAGGLRHCCSCVLTSGSWARQRSKFCGFCQSAAVQPVPAGSAGAASAVDGPNRTVVASTNSAASAAPSRRHPTVVDRVVGDPVPLVAIT